MEINAIRDLLSQGETLQALAALRALAEKDPRYKNYLPRILRSTEANYNAVRQQELKGILSFQEAQREYNRINDTILVILDDVEAGRVPTQEKSRRRMWALAGAGFLALAALVYWVALGRGDSDCPRYDMQGLHVLVLPFDKLSGTDAQPSIRIRDEINALVQKNNKENSFPVEAQVYRKAQIQGLSRADAEALARGCDAVNLVVWGQYSAYNTDSIRVKVGFQFLDAGKTRGETAFMTFRDVTDITVDKNLKNAVFSICSMLAIRNGNKDLAKRWLAKMSDQDKDAVDRQMAALLETQQQ